MNFIRKLLNATLLLLGVLILVTFFLALNSCSKCEPGTPCGPDLCQGGYIFNSEKDYLNGVLNAPIGSDKLCQRVNEIRYIKISTDLKARNNVHDFCSNEILQLDRIVGEIEKKASKSGCIYE